LFRPRLGALFHLRLVTAAPGQAQFHRPRRFHLRLVTAAPGQVQFHRLRRQYLVTVRCLTAGVTAL
jgi:hypothetical protein